jgi:hypothetical protein
MGQDQRVDPPVPGRESLVERDDDAIRIGSTIDEEPAATRALDQNGVALPDVEDRDPGPAVGTMKGDGQTTDDRGCQCQRRDLLDPPAEPSALLRRAIRRRGRSPGEPRSPAAKGSLDRAEKPNPIRADTEDEQGGGTHGRCNEIQWRRQADARERQRGARLDRRDDDGEEYPGGQSAEGGDECGQTGTHGETGAKCNSRRCHCGRNERHDDQTHDRRHERQAAKRGEHHRRRRCLGCE